jgi:hypothetical protein
VSKPLKKAAELISLLNAELRKHDACAGMTVDGISPVVDDRVDYTWGAHTEGGRCQPRTAIAAGALVKMLVLFA